MEEPPIDPILAPTNLDHERRIGIRTPEQANKWNSHLDTAEYLLLQLERGDINRDEFKRRFAGVIMIYDNLASLSTVTDLPNRRSFMEDTLSPRIREMQQDSNLTGFVGYLDVDNLKLANKLGLHTGGDQLLDTVTFALRFAQKELEEILKEEFPNLRINLAHLSGDEFAFLISGVDKFVAARFGRLVLQKMTNLMQTLDVFQRGVLKDFPKDTSASIGLREVNGQSDGDSTVEQADLAMFCAKRKGKGQVVFFEDMNDDDRLQAAQDARKS